MSYEYKVLSQKDGWLNSKFNPAQLEAALNSQASQGWKLVTAVTAEIPAIMGGKREELVLVMERERL